jgi:hypothetical protein
VEERLPGVVLQIPSAGHKGVEVLFSKRASGPRDDQNFVPLEVLLEPEPLLNVRHGRR